MALATTTFGSTVRVGDKVAVDDPNYPGVWTVTKLNPVNITLRQDGRDRGLRAPRTMLLPASEAKDATPAWAKPIGSQRVEGLRTGAVVTLGRHTMKGYDQDQLYVVTAEKYNGNGVLTVNVSPLGGHPERRYLRAPAEWVTVVDPATVHVV